MKRLSLLLLAAASLGLGGCTLFAQPEAATCHCNHCDDAAYTAGAAPARVRRIVPRSQTEMLTGGR